MRTRRALARTRIAAIQFRPAMRSGTSEQEEHLVVRSDLEFERAARGMPRNKRRRANGEISIEAQTGCVDLPSHRTANARGRQYSWRFAGLTRRCERGSPFHRKRPLGVRILLTRHTK